MSHFLTQLAMVLGRELRDADRIARERLTTAERRLGFTFPALVAEFYVRAGAAPELQEHNRLREPEGLQLEDGFLVFMEENQNVVDWAMRLPLEADPIVWQRINGGDDEEWYSEEMPFSAFIVKNLAFTRGVELSDEDL